MTPIRFFFFSTREERPKGNREVASTTCPYTHLLSHSSTPGNPTANRSSPNPYYSSFYPEESIT
uniref:Uncharacterized protein n=1 Tax=Solanum lycopersicum TaxID=4081 RepID=A0A3Q7IJ92_SOLLC